MIKKYTFSFGRICFCLSIVLLVICTLWVFPLNAQANSPAQVSISSADGTPGHNVTLNVSLRSTVQLGGLKVKISFDPDHLSLTGMSIPAALGLHAVNSKVPGEVLFNLVNANGLPLSADIASMVFTIKPDCPAGTYSINSSYIKACDISSATTDSTAINGTINVVPSISPTPTNTLTNTPTTTNMPTSTPSVKPVKQKNGYLDVPSNNQVVSGTISINGWFYDYYGVAKIEVLIDSKAVGQATYGTTRKDVMVVYPEYGTNCGYTYILNTTSLTAGTHSIAIHETGNDGKVTALPIKNITVNQTPTRGFIDHPVNSEVLGGIYNVCGWFLDAAGVSEIEVLVDGQIAGQATYGLSRPDVMKVYPLYNNSNSGFNLKLDITQFNEGAHSIVVREISNNGVVTILPTKTVTFSKKLPAIGYIDYPSTNEKVNGMYNIRGWFLDAGGVAKLEVVIDSVVVGEVKYGTSRPDVMKVYPLYNNPNCGYSYSLDTSLLSDGTHTLTIRETSKTGVVTSLAVKSFLK